MEDFEFDIEEVLCFYAMAVIYRVSHKIGSVEKYWGVFLVS